MAVDSTTAFCEMLARSRLLSPNALASAKSIIEAESDPQHAARRLVSEGTLTTWQAQQILAGRHQFFLGKYKLLDKLGEGGMGAVYKAQQSSTGRIVAIKLMSENVVKQPGALARFHREIRAAAALDHPNIVAALDADQVGGSHFLVMAYAEGRDLKEWIKEFGRLPIDWSCECIRQAALGLQHAHERGLAHRDIKPSNLLVVTDECTPHAPREEKDLTRSVRSTLVVKILDMGLARFTSEVQCTVLTQTGQVLGTIDYISPEQAKDTKGAGIAADIFSLGASLFHMITGQVPYTGKNPMEKLMARAMRDAPLASTLRPDIPPARRQRRGDFGRCLITRRDHRPHVVPQGRRPFCLSADLSGDEDTQSSSSLSLPTRPGSTIVAEADQTLHAFLNQVSSDPGDIDIDILVPTLRVGTPAPDAPRPSSPIDPDFRSHAPRGNARAGRSASEAPEDAIAIEKTPPSAPRRPPRIAIGIGALALLLLAIGVWWSLRGGAVGPNPDAAPLDRIAQVTFGPWHLCGPFEREGAHPPEKGVDLTATYPGKGGRKIGWRQQEFADGQVHSLALFGPGGNTDAAAYLFREIESPAAGVYLVSFGADDAIDVWVNGRHLQTAATHGGPPRASSSRTFASRNCFPPGWRSICRAAWSGTGRSTRPRATRSRTRPDTPATEISLARSSACPGIPAGRCDLKGRTRTSRCPGSANWTR